MTPHLVKWQSMFGNEGFVVVEVDNGAVDKLTDVREYVQAAKISYPVLHDASGEVCQRFGVRAYPCAYLINRDGQVIWEGFEMPDQGRLQQRIEEALRGGDSSSSDKTNKP
jgi:alkyl hydroperoxide reductase subunit AhpC